MTEESRLLDPSALERLLDWGGQDLVGKMIDLFSENAPGKVNQIRQGVHEGDLRLVERGAHSLKSSSGNVGAERVRSLAQRIEALAEAGEGEEVPHLLEELDKTLARTVPALAERKLASEE